MNLICAELKKSEVSNSALFLSETVDQWYQALKKEKNEVFILNTCQRFLILIRNECKLSLTRLFDELKIKATPEFCYNGDAVVHLFSVISGLESPILGENEILGQIKLAFKEAQRLKYTGAFLNELVKRAINTGKQARSKTALVKLSDTYSSVSFQFIKQHLPNIKSKKILILGTGKLGKQLLNYFHNKTILPITLASRTRQRAKVVAGDRANSMAIKDILNPLDEYDVIIGATESQYPIWSFKNTPAIQPKVFIDLGMPPNFKVDSSLDNLYYYDLKDVEIMMERTKDAKLAELPKVMKIVQDEADNFKYWHNARKVAPLIQSFNQITSAIKEEEYNWVINKLGDLTPEQEEIIQKLIFRIVSRMSSSPISAVKNYAQEDHKKAHIDAFKEMFNIE